MTQGTATERSTGYPVNCPTGLRAESTTVVVLLEVDGQRSLQCQWATNRWGGDGAKRIRHAELDRGV